MKCRHTSLSLLTAVLLGIAPLSHAAQNESNKTSAKEVRQEVGDAVEAIKNYSADKRDEAAAKAQAALDALDTRIDAIEKRIEKNWAKMDQAARERAHDTLSALRKQRVEVAEWYGGLKNSTANSWEHVKRGFSDSYKMLKSSLEKAGQDHPDDKKN